jgi:N-acyl-D-aspartate/D-glutamate deacylase
MRLSFLTGAVYETLPRWADFFRLSPEGRLHQLSSLEGRDRLRRGAEEANHLYWADWEHSSVADVRNPELQPLIGRTFGSLGRERGCTAFDALCEVLVADSLATGIQTPFVGDDDESWAERVKLWGDERVVIGGSDAGAHLDLMQTFAYSTRFLAAVRERRLLPIEEAIRLVTDVAAHLYGLRERGRLQLGWHADIVVFDPETIGCGGVEMRPDLPGGAARLTADSIGIEHVLVNGVETVTAGQLTGEAPGTVLRSGRNTYTPRMRT